MKNFRPLICWLKGHDYHLDKIYTRSTRRLKCARCERLFAMNDEHQCVVPWNPEMDAFMEMIVDLHNNPPKTL